MSAPLADAAGRNDPCPCGSGIKFKKCCMGKSDATASFIPSPQAATLLQHAQRAFNAHNLNEAEALATQALELNPRDSDAVHLMANVFLKRGDFAKAEEWVRKCIALDKRNGGYYLTYAVILQEQRKIDEALAMNKKALSVNSSGFIPHIYSNMGLCHLDKREPAAAIECFSKALGSDPNFALAYFNRGIAYFSLKGTHSAEMEADFNRAVELDPGNAVMYQKMTAIYYEKRNYLQAIKLLRHAIGLRPDLEDAWVLLANSYYKIGNTETALTIYKDLAERYPHNPTVAFEYACMFPVIAMSNEDITAWRERFMRNLDGLMQRNFLMPDPEWRVFTLPFFHGYHGRDNLALMKKMAEFFLHSCPSLHFTAPHCVDKPRKKDRLRIGFVSELFYSDLLTQFYGPLLDALAKDDRFEVVLMANSGRKNEAVDRLAAGMRYVMLPAYLAPAQQAIAREELDMLVYLDIGMSVMNYMLAFTRLAPIQMVMGGHPITTGIPNMDYFLSSHTAEPENGAKHYSEKLLLPEKNTVVFPRKKMPADTKTRRELGLPEDARLYACPVQLFKLHPDMDKVFASILTRDSKAIVILIDATDKTLWRASLQKRFAAAMPPELAARIHFLPYAAGDMFYHYMRAMDCVLDTFHFSFGTTAFQMLGADVPFVTLPGEFMRGRAGYLLYRQMDMPELIAESPEHYVELALKLAQDKSFHERMVEAIRTNSNRVFDDYSVVEPFVTMLWDLHSANTEQPQG